jgi:hypothetical protein
MTGHSSADLLEQECRVFTRYLAGAEVTPYLVEAYGRGHRHMPALKAEPDLLDGWLLGFARRSPWCARLADAYARQMRPTGILRQKLVLQLAVLEVSPSTHAWVNGGDVGPIPVVLARIMLAAGLSVLSLAVAALIFGPIHLLASTGSHVGTS